MKKLFFFSLIQLFFIFSAGAHCGSCGVGDAHSKEKSDCQSKEDGDKKSCSSQAASNTSGGTENAPSGSGDDTATTSETENR